jgi:hypothetical protein
MVCLLTYVLMDLFHITDLSWSRINQIHLFLIRSKLNVVTLDFR